MLLPHNKLIAFVSNSAWSVYNFRLDVINHLIQQGFKVMVMAPNDTFSPLLEEAGCQFIPLHFDNKTKNPLHDIAFYYQLKKLYRQYRPDFIFHYVAKPNIYGSLAAAANDIPSVAVITGLGYAFDKKNWLYRIMRLLYTRSLRAAKEVWFLNNEDARVFIDEKIVTIEKVKVLPGEGINTAYFSPIAPGLAYNSAKPVNKEPQRKEQPFTFLMSTRLLRSKGIGLYADAARILRKKNYDVQVELIGFFEDHHPDSITKEELERWQREGLVHYGGFAKDVRPWLQRADCFVFPSFYNEGIPRCLMEAASMELPVITSLNRGCKEVVINNTTGFTCNRHDPFDLADKMEKMINLPLQQRIQMGKSGRALVLRKFDITHIIEEYTGTLQQDILD